MMTDYLVVHLILILTVAWVLGSLFYRWGLPVILGELVAGLILGPTLLGIISWSEPIKLMAELGIFFLIFFSGMEMDPEELLEHMKPALLVAVGGFALPFFLGYISTRAFGGTQYQSLFMGMGLAITSLAVQARMLTDMQIHKSQIGHIIIGAAIADDILALMTLSLLLGLAQSGNLDVLNILFVLFKVGAFFAVVIVVSHYLLGNLDLRFDPKGPRAFTFALLVALVLGYCAELAGLHLVIGAFVAGQFVRKLVRDPKVFEVIRDRFYGLSYGFLAPIFFVSLSFHIHLQLDLSLWIFTAVITIMAIIGKLVGCTAGGIVGGRTFWESSTIAFGMNGRGAIELVIAVVVVNLSDQLMASGSITEPLLTNEQFSALILMAFITTLISPISLKWIMKKGCSADKHTEVCKVWDKQQHR
ncbi:MAG: cation:proton antiporter [Proteobacteria bacterium]|nr:cation:proton antiporter [Pseudomonadota bacterium]